MPEFTGRLRTPRLPSAPTSPVVGEMYYDTVTNKLFWWNGTLWVAASGASEVYEQAAQPSSTTVGALWIDTDEVPPTFVSPIPFVASLPASPVDGQECYYQNAALATLGVVWRFRYRAASASAYKWEFVGGPPIFSRTSDAVTVTSGTYGIFGSPPGFYNPLAGEYWIKQGVMTHFYGQAGSGGIADQAVWNNSTGAVLTNITPASFISGANAGGTVTGSGLEALAVNQQIIVVNKTSAQNHAIQQRWIEGTPIRVSG